MDDRGDNVKDFGFTSIWNIPLVVKQYSIKKWGNHAVVDHLHIIGLFDVDVDQLQDLLLDRSKTANFGSLGRDISLVKSTSSDRCRGLELTIFCNRVRNQLA